MDAREAKVGMRVTGYRPGRHGVGSSVYAARHRMAGVIEKFSKKKAWVKLDRVEKDDPERVQVLLEWIEKERKQ